MTHNLLVNLSFLLSQPTGLATYAGNLFPYLKSLEPTLLTANKIDNFNCVPVPPNLTQAQGTKGNIQRLLWTEFQLPKLYHHLKTSLLFSPIPEAPIYSNCRFVVTVHDLIPLRFPRRFSALTLYCRYYLPQVLAQAEHIICDSVATKKDLQTFFSLPDTKITPVLLAYDKTHFRPLPKDTQPSTIPYFFYIGRHDPYKNLHRLITAFAKLPNYQDYQLWIAGSSDPRFTPLLKTQTDELGLSEQIKFLDYLPYEQLPQILNQALALVFPSLWEGFGLPVLEAMGCGTPVITSNLSSLPEVAGDAALLVNPYKVEEITAAMEALATDAQLRSRLSQQSLHQASQFSWQKTAQETVEVLTRHW
ncbi:glycosyl transferase group 1 [Gloeothece citriformis PCC 7424]|uniref:Glycosyl transferase group 1 n=1 Tax=Gloeothece citriformis (strain PCC 7424) TaxID=65393 RepID=B7K802_GLOC7|nr:glycosyltransferase family 1 protein [Gloeothece citriformis]ACK68490.1 glycosyl transferase group 1 [Gloeothece citriformis PCC 7424]